ncbi:hypothetical protein ACFVFF_38740 [Streptomyces sp. NPDC057680]
MSHDTGWGTISDPGWGTSDTGWVRRRDIGWGTHDDPEWGATAPA